MQVHDWCFKKLRSVLSVAASVTPYKSYIRLILKYADIVLSGLCKTQADSLKHFRLHICQVILRLPLFLHTSHSYFLKTIHLHALSSRRSCHLALLSYKISHQLQRDPKHLSDKAFKQRTQPSALGHTQSFEKDIPVP